MRRRHEFRRIWKQALADSTFKTVNELSRMLRSRDADSRLYALFQMRSQIGRKPLKAYFSLAELLIDDPDNDCRWQAIIVVGEYVSSNPSDVWQVVVKYGNSDDSDMRTAVATVLLEHLLEYHFLKFFPRVKRESAKSPLFADTLERCSPFGQAKRNWRKVESLLKQVRV